MDELIFKFKRKTIPPGNKERVWFAIQNHLREKRQVEFLPVFRFRRIALAGLIAVVVLGLMGVASKASEGSLPGDRLYSVKKAAETVEKVLATNNEAKVKVAIKHAKRRLEEVQILVAENKGPQIVTQTLEDLKSTTEQVIVIAAASKPQLLDHAVKLVNEETEVLTAVSDQSSGEVKQVVENVIAASNESISKATGTAGNEEVQGTATTTQGTDDPAATSTASGDTSTAAKPKPKDGTVESDIQIHGVTKIEPENKPAKPTEPEILPEPTVGY